MLNRVARGACALLVTGLIGCGQHGSGNPTSAQIESAGVAALQGRQATALRQLTEWARDGLPVAQRELGLVYASSLSTQSQAAHWLEQAARSGDGAAQRELAQAFYGGKLGLPVDHGKAWQWFETVARRGDGKASFMLARMAKYGQGVKPDLALSVHWLQEASLRGNAQAMFLLSNAYASGEGVAQDARRARYWLERSAAGDYPVAIHALALELEGQAGSDPTAATEARHLIKEAMDERRMRWNRYQ